MKRQHFGVLLVIFFIEVVSGFAPALFHHLKKKDIQQFGECSLQETQDIFVDYPEVCYSSFRDLSSEIKSNNQDKTVYQQLYTQLCSQECTEQVKTFSQECDAPQYTDPFLHACEQNTVSGDFCLVAGLSQNNGLEAATDCYSALAVDQCSDSCKSSLVQLKNHLGCCINSLFNVTTYGLDKFNIAEYDLWVLCGIEVVESCNNSPLALTASQSSVPTQKISPVVIIFALIFGVWLYL